MKILYYVEEKNTLMYKWQEYHIYDELKHYDIEVEIFNYLAYETAVDANDALHKRMSLRDVDLFMTPLNDEKLFTDSLKVIRKMGIPTLLICFDNLVVPFYHKKICKYFDLVWLTSSETEYLFKKWGANTIFLPYAANPHLFKPNDNKIDEIPKTCFVGSPYGSRVNIINSAVNGGLNLDLFSNYTKSEHTRSRNGQQFTLYIKPFFDLVRFSYGRKIIFGALKNKFIKQSSLNVSSSNLRMLNPVNLYELGSVYSSYALSLSSTTARNTGVLKHPLDIVNLRSFEIPMAGGIQICKYNNELAEYFEEGKEIVFYTNERDMIKKIQHLLLPENKCMRDEMKKAARLRAENEHSWFSRFRVVFDYFKLDYAQGK